ncbi:MAG: HTTM domain-containing protein, partial [Pseudomonadota bacterium]
YALTQAGVGLVGWNHHHVYILGVSCIFLSLTDCGRSYSFDRWRKLQNDGYGDPEFGTLWGQRLIALQMSALYFWTAVDKTDMAFISGQRLEQIFLWSYSGRVLEVFLTSPMLLAAMSIAVVVVEYFLAFAILSQRWRKVAIPVGLSMHATFYLMLPVDTYSATMILLYLALLDPNAVRTFTERMQSR